MNHGTAHCPTCDSTKVYCGENEAECANCGWIGPVYTLRRDKDFGDKIMDKLTHKDKETLL